MVSSLHWHKVSISDLHWPMTMKTSWVSSYKPCQRMVFVSGKNHQQKRVQSPKVFVENEVIAEFSILVNS